MQKLAEVERKARSYSDRFQGQRDSTDYLESIGILAIDCGLPLKRALTQIDASAFIAEKIYPQQIESALKVLERAYLQARQESRSTLKISRRNDSYYEPIMEVIERLVRLKTKCSGSPSLTTLEKIAREELVTRRKYWKSASFERPAAKIVTDRTRYLYKS